MWLAASKATGRLRAVKVIPLQGAHAAGREICSIARLEANLDRQHPDLINIHHVGKTAEHLFYVMDLADDANGGPGTDDPGYRPASLDGRLKRRRPAPEECLRYTRQLLAGLAFLHDSGMVHRDVKPANCLFLRGELKLADFGLLADAGEQVSRVGTQTYMPPDGRMDARADVYAAGLVIYEMLSGLPAESFPRLGDRAKGIVSDPTLDALMGIVLRACEPDPADRFADARAMFEALEKSLCKPPSRRFHLPRRIAVVFGGIFFASCLAAGGFWWNRTRPVHVNFVTHPFEATVWLDGVRQTAPDGSPYRTPCTIENLPPRPCRVTFHHDQRGDLVLGPRDFAEERRIEGVYADVPRGE